MSQPQAYPVASVQRLMTDDGSKGKFIVDGIDMAAWVPEYYLHSTQTREDRSTVYHLRSNSEKTLFINALYYACYQYLSYLGFEPLEYFEYTRLNPWRFNNPRYSIYDEEILPRLIVGEDRIPKDGTYLIYRKVVMRLFSNEKDLDYGIYLRFMARTVDLVLFPYITLQNDDQSMIAPEYFVRQLLLTMKYPLYIYHYNRLNGTLGRIYRTYPDLINKKNKYTPWGFTP